MVECVEHFPVHAVTQAFQRVHNALQGLAVLVSRELADVFDHDRLRALCFDDPGRLEEESSPGVRHPPPVADDAERLTRQTGEQHVVVGHLVGVDVGDVADRSMTKVRLVDVSRCLVDVGGEDARHTNPGRGNVETADPAKQVSERLQAGWRRRCAYKGVCCVGEYGCRHAVRLLVASPAYIAIGV